MAQFDHERLDAYQVAIDFVALADDVVENLPRGRGHLADQLQRASLSVALNIAEGAGEYSPKDKKRFYSGKLICLNTKLCQFRLFCNAVLGQCRFQLVCGCINRSGVFQLLE